MGPGRRQLTLADVSPDQKGAAAAGRVHDQFIAPADTEAVDQVHHFRAGIELAEFVTLFRGNEAFKDAADDVIIQAGKIEVVNLIDEGAPVGHGGVAVKRQAIAEAGVIFPKNGFVISRHLLGFGKMFFEMEAESIRPGRYGRGPTILFNWPW